MRVLASGLDSRSAWRRAWAAPLHACALTLLLLAPSASAQEGWAQTLLAHEALWAWFLGAFLGGLALNLTPCVYPMIPVTLAFFGGQKADRIGYSIRLSVLYVVGMSLMYAVLGLIATNTGILLGSWLQHPVVLIGIAILMVALALSMFGLYELRPPRWIAQRLGQAPAGSVGAFVMGLTVGLIAAPCVGPFVLGLLVFVGQLARPMLGFWLLFTMGVGMGVPFLILGVLANRSARWPKAGEWLVWVKKLLGLVLLGLGVRFLKPLLAPYVLRAVCISGLAVAGVYLGWLEPSRFPGRTIWIRRIVAAALFASALLWIPHSRASHPAIAWEPYTTAKLEQARREHRPVIIDVYADWCVPCVELDHVTFSHPGVAAQLKSFRTLRIDATGELPSEAQELLDRYEVLGVPTIILFNAQGQTRAELRVSGFIPPSEMLALLSKAAAS